MCLQAIDIDGPADSQAFKIRCLLRHGSRQWMPMRQAMVSVIVALACMAITSPVLESADFAASNRDNTWFNPTHDGTYAF
jgi:hypothetical protein